MNDFLTHSAYISVFISLIAFYLGSKLFLKFHFPLFNPLPQGDRHGLQGL